MRKEEEVPYTSCFLNLCVSCSVLTLICGIIIYYIYGILYLVKGYEVCKECNKSQLWEYILTSLVLGFLRTNIKNTDKKDNTNHDDATPVCVLICVGLIDLGLASWGGIELWIKPCNNLVDTNIWKFALITFCIQTTCSVLALLVVPCGIVCIVKKITDLDTDRESIV